MRSSGGEKRRLRVWVEKMAVLVIMYSLVHLCLLLAVLTPLLRRFVRSFSFYNFIIFRSSSDERPFGEPSLPPGAVVPDIVPVQPPVVERPRLNEEEYVILIF